MAAVVEIVLNRYDRPGVIHVPDAGKVADEFFKSNASARDESNGAVPSYDQWVRSPENPPDRFVEMDVQVLNSWMGAMTPQAIWSHLTATGDGPDWLRDLDSDLDLFVMSDEEWEQTRPLIRRAFDPKASRPLIGKGHVLALATKILHLKRPTLIPVCDSLVMYLLGIPVGTAAETVIGFVREQGRKNRVELGQIRQQLEQGGIERSMVRVFDAILWSC